MFAASRTFRFFLLTLSALVLTALFAPLAGATSDTAPMNPAGPCHPPHQTDRTILPDSGGSGSPCTSPPSMPGNIPIHPTTDQPPSKPMPGPCESHGVAAQTTPDHGCDRPPPDRHPAPTPPPPVKSPDDTCMTPPPASPPPASPPPASPPPASPPPASPPPASPPPASPPPASPPPASPPPASPPPASPPPASPPPASPPPASPPPASPPQARTTGAPQELPMTGPGVGALVLGLAGVTSVLAGLALVSLSRRPRRAHGRHVSVSTDHRAARRAPGLDWRTPLLRRLQPGVCRPDSTHSGPGAPPPRAYGRHRDPGPAPRSRTQANRWAFDDAARHHTSRPGAPPKHRHCAPTARQGVIAEQTTC